MRGERWWPLVLLVGVPTALALNWLLRTAAGHSRRDRPQRPADAHDRRILAIYVIACAIETDVFVAFGLIAMLLGFVGFVTVPCRRRHSPGPGTVGPLTAPGFDCESVVTVRVGQRRRPGAASA